MIISKTPLRLSFAGGGTDLPKYYKENINAPGAVISGAISWYIYITVNKKYDDTIRVCYSKTEIVNDVDKLEHNIIREALKMLDIKKGIEIVYMSDIPMVTSGSGLGSSSSLAVGVLKALYAYKGQQISPEKLAQDACRLEMEILKHPIGKQDQYAAAYGGLNYIQFNHNESVYVDPIVIPENVKQAISSKIMLFDTNISRISSDILAEQGKAVVSKLDYYNKLSALVQQVKNAFYQQDFMAIGRLLHEGWSYKTKLASNISNPKIDHWYQKALAAGAMGGKVAGAGGGGFLMIYCDESKQANVRQALSELKCFPIQFESEGSKIIYFND